MKPSVRWVEEADAICSSTPLEDCEDRCRFGCYQRAAMVREAQADVLEDVAQMLERTGFLQDEVHADRIRALKRAIILGITAPEDLASDEAAA